MSRTPRTPLSARTAGQCAGSFRRRGPRCPAAPAVRRRRVRCRARKPRSQPCRTAPQNPDGVAPGDASGQRTAVTIPGLRSPPSASLTTPVSVSSIHLHVVAETASGSSRSERRTPPSGKRHAGVGHRGPFADPGRGGRRGGHHRSGPRSHRRSRGGDVSPAGRPCCHDPYVVAPHRGGGGQDPVDASHQTGGLAQPRVVAGLLGQILEVAGQGAGVSVFP